VKAMKGRAAAATPRVSVAPESAADRVDEQLLRIYGGRGTPGGDQAAHRPEERVTMRPGSDSFVAEVPLQTSATDERALSTWTWTLPARSTCRSW